MVSRLSSPRPGGKRPRDAADRSLSRAWRMSFATALVTGSSGFIGRALVAHLRKCGKRVVALGRTTSALPPAERQIRLEASSAGRIAEALHGEAVDVVFHCAA